MDQRTVDAAAIEAEVDHVRSLGIDALRKRWRLMFGATPPKGLTKDIIARMIACRIQGEAFGGLDRKTVKPDLNTAFMQVSDPKEKLSKFKMTWHYASGGRRPRPLLAGWAVGSASGGAVCSALGGSATPACRNSAVTAGVASLRTSQSLPLC